MAFEQVFKNIDNALRTDEGCSSELDYVEQSSWILFLKYLDDLDKENEMAALLGGGVYASILDKDAGRKIAVQRSREVLFSRAGSK